jgi:hypothetical protein
MSSESDVKSRAKQRTLVLWHTFRLEVRCLPLMLKIYKTMTHRPNSKRRLHQKKGIKINFSFTRVLYVLSNTIRPY